MYMHIWEYNNRLFCKSIEKGNLFPSHIASFSQFYKFTYFLCHHHHDVMPPARISLDPLSPLLPIVHRFWQVLWATSHILPELAWPCEGVHKRTLLMSSSPLVQECPACLVRLSLIVFVMGSRWPYNWCFVGCCLQDLFKIARSILG